MENTFYILGTSDGKVFYRSSNGFIDFSEEAYRFYIGKGFDDRERMKAIISITKNDFGIDLVPFEMTVKYQTSNILEN